MKNSPMRQTILSVVVVSFALVCLGRARNQGAQTAPKTLNETRRPPDKGWAVSVLSVEIPKSVPAYMPPGKGSAECGSIIKFAEFNPSGGIRVYISMVVAKPDDKDDKTVCEFIAGEITPSTNRVLVLAKFEILNASPTTKSFEVGDMRFRSGKGEPRGFGAVGQGDSYLFIKASEPEKKAANEVKITLAPGEKEQLSFLLGSDSTGTPLTYSFLGSNWTEIRESKGK